MEKLFCKVKMEHPYTMVVSGQTGSGKTQFVSNLLKHFNDFDRVIFAYFKDQPLYDDIVKIPNVEMVQGFPDDVETGNVKTLLVLDDLMWENGKRVAQFFTRMRHANLSVIYITQNFYHDDKYMRTATRNAHYIVLFSNPRDCSMISVLGRQMFPKRPKFVEDAFCQATSKPFGYLFLDCKPVAEHRVKEGVFPFEKMFVYKPA